MPHIVLEHDPAVEDQRIIDEGFLTTQAERAILIWTCSRASSATTAGTSRGACWAGCGGAGCTSSGCGWRPPCAVEATDAACWSGRKPTPGRPAAGPPSRIPSIRRPWPSTGAAATKRSPCCPIFRRVNANIFWSKPSVRPTGWIGRIENPLTPAGDRPIH
jgi:hypothetical protein